MCSGGCLWSPHNINTSHCSEPLHGLGLTLTQPTNVFFLNSPIVLEACFTNNSNTTIEANPFYPESGMFMVTEHRSDIIGGQRRKSLTKVHVKRIGNPPNPPPLPRSWHTVNEPRPICLGPHQEQRFVFDLTTCSSWSCFEGPGVFEIDIIFESEGQHLEPKAPLWEGKISSNKIRIEVLK